MFMSEKLCWCETYPTHHPPCSLFAKDHFKGRQTAKGVLYSKEEGEFQHDATQASLVNLLTEPPRQCVKKTARKMMNAIFGYEKSGECEVAFSEPLYTLPR